MNTEAFAHVLYKQLERWYSLKGNITVPCIIIIIIMSQSFPCVILLIYNTHNDIMTNNNTYV